MTPSADFVIGRSPRRMLRPGMGAETWAKQLKVALRADDYTVDGNTVTLTLGDGVAADGESACGVAAATSGTNVAVVLSYSDGDVAC